MDLNILNVYSPDELKSLARRLAWNSGFGCYTRLGFELLIWPAIREDARWIVFFDVDGVHALNEKFKGYEVVDAMIKNVFESLRSTDIVAGQLKSGDEFLICITERNHHQESGTRGELDPQGLVSRLIKELKRHGLTATFAVAEVTSPDLLKNIQPAVEEVYAAKKARGASR
jgi:GGDEF domain-containing protein